MKDNEDNGKAKAFLGIVTVGRKVSMVRNCVVSADKEYYLDAKDPHARVCEWQLAKIATSLGLSPRSGVSQPQQGSRPPINTALAALLSPRRPVSYAGSPCGTTPGPVRHLDPRSAASIVVGIVWNSNAVSAIRQV